MTLDTIKRGLVRELNHFKTDFADLKKRLSGKSETSTYPAVLPVLSPIGTVGRPVATVDEALKRLTELGHVNALWEKKVTRVNPLKKIFGVIAYIFGKSAASKNDKSAVALNERAVTLVQSVVNRYWTKEECEKKGRDRPAMSLEEHERFNALQDIANHAQQEFYDAFKMRMNALKVNENSNEFRLYCLAANRLLDNQFTNEKHFSHLTDSQKIIAKSSIPIKIETTKTEFNDKVLVDMIKGYAAQPLIRITRETYNEIIDNLSRTNEVRPFIEKLLLDAIKAEHAAELATICDEYLDPNDEFKRQAKFIETKTLDLKNHSSNLEIEFRDLEKRIATAQGNVEELEIYSKFVQQELDQALGEMPKLTKDKSPEEALNAVNTELNPSRNSDSGETLGTKVDRLRGQLEAAVNNKAEANDELNGLKQRQSELATFRVDTESGELHLIGGELFIVKSKLTHLEAAAAKEIEQLTEFYSELNEKISDGKKANSEKRLIDLGHEEVQVVVEDNFNFDWS